MKKNLKTAYNTRRDMKTIKHNHDYYNIRETAITEKFSIFLEWRNKKKSVKMWSTF